MKNILTLDTYTPKNDLEFHEKDKKRRKLKNVTDEPMD